MSLDFAVTREIDLTKDITIPSFEVIRATDVTIHMIALDCAGNVLDLDDLSVIKVEARKRFTSTDVIFTATKTNGKIVEVDTDAGLYDVVLTTADTDFSGDALVQALYQTNAGLTHKSPMVRVIFRESFIGV